MILFLNMTDGSQVRLEGDEDVRFDGDRVKLERIPLLVAEKPSGLITYRSELTWQGDGGEESWKPRPHEEDDLEDHPVQCWVLARHVLQCMIPVE